MERREGSEWAAGREKCEEIPVGRRDADADAIPVRGKERRQVSDWGSLDGMVGGGGATC